MTLAFSDVEQLSRSPYGDVRAEIARKLAESFAESELKPGEKAVAIGIFRLLMRDAEMKVRQALSENLCRARDIPHDLALTLAKDVEDVALPMLEFSEVLGDTDLVWIIQSAKEVAKWVAVSRREIVSEKVSDALLTKKHSEVTRGLFENPGAQISEAAILETIAEMAEYESVMDALLRRGGLPLTCVEKIFTHVTDEIKKRLIQRHQLSRHLAEGRFEYAREMATLDAACQAERVAVHELVEELHAKRKLTSSIVIRSLCVGDLRFFEEAMARLTGVPVGNVRQLMLDSGENGFKALYKASPLPPAYHDAVKKLLDITWEETGNGRHIPQDFCKRLVDKITANGYDLSIECMPLLLAIIKGNASEPKSLH